MPLHEKDVQNKNEIEDDVTQFLGHKAPPAIEFIFVEAVQPEVYLLPRIICGGWGVAFGHAAIAFTRSDGSRRLVNITHGTGEKDEVEMVDVWESPDDYLFGVKGRHGIFSRPMAIVRIQEWDQNGVDAIEHSLRAAVAAFHCTDTWDGRRSNVAWHQCGSCLAFLSWLGCWGVRRTGNCADFITRACFEGGLLSRPHAFPKAAVVDMLGHLIFDRINQGKAPRAELIYFRQAAAGRAARPHQRFAVWHSIVSPLRFAQSLAYYRLEQFASAIVTVEADADGDLQARVLGGRKRYPLCARRVLKHWHACLVVLTCAMWIAFGYPRADTAPVTSAYTARVLMACGLLVINALVS